MALGGQTVTVRTLSGGTESDWLQQPDVVAVDTEWPGVLFRPSSGGETVGLTDVASKVWWCTGDPIPAAVNASAADQLVYNGDVFGITLVEPFSDFAGLVTHVKVTCHRQEL